VRRFEPRHARQHGALVARVPDLAAGDHVGLVQRLQREQLARRARAHQPHLPKRAPPQRGHVRIVGQRRARARGGGGRALGRGGGGGEGGRLVGGERVAGQGGLELGAAGGEEGEGWTRRGRGIARSWCARAAPRPSPTLLSLPHRPVLSATARRWAAHRPSINCLAVSAARRVAGVGEASAGGAGATRGAAGAPQNMAGGEGGRAGAPGRRRGCGQGVGAPRSFPLPPSVSSSTRPAATVRGVRRRERARVGSPQGANARRRARRARPLAPLVLAHHPSCPAAYPAYASSRPPPCAPAGRPASQTAAYSSRTCRVGVGVGVSGLFFPVWAIRGNRPPAAAPGPLARPARGAPAARAAPRRRP
jgi:hypothetical protein